MGKCDLIISHVISTDFPCTLYGKLWKHHDCCYNKYDNYWNSSINLEWTMKTLGGKRWIKNHVSPMIIGDPSLLVGFWYHATDHGNMCKITLIVCETWWFVHWYFYIIHISSTISTIHQDTFSLTRKTFLTHHGGIPQNCAGVRSQNECLVVLFLLDFHLYSLWWSNLTHIYERDAWNHRPLISPYLTSFYLVYPPSNMVESASYKLFLDDQ